MADKSRLFVREASGLVRAVGTFNATFFNLASLSGNVVLWAPLFLSLFSGAVILGVAPLAWGHLIAGVSLFIMAFIFVILVMVMPRSGGDYVFTSRIVHPLLGWLESWMLVWTNLAIIAFELTSINLSTQAFLGAMGAVNPSSGWSAASAWISVSSNQLIYGSIITILIALISIMSPKKFYTVISAFCIVAVVAAVTMAAGTFTIDPNVFASNLQTYAGTKVQDIINAANSAGITYGATTFPLFASMFAFGLFNLIGFQYSGYIAGELKGKLKRTAAVSMIGSVVIYLVFIWILLNGSMVSKFGYELTNSWGYLYWFNPSAAPLGGIPPTNAVYGIIGRPDLWPVWLFVTVGGCLLMFALCPAYLVVMSRFLFAWSMDRVAPAWFSKLNERTATPVRAYLLLAFGGWVFFVASVYGLSLLSLAWYSVLLSALTWIMPGINSLLLPFRRKDLYESSPWKRFAGVPIPAILGVVWLIIIIPVYSIAYFSPIITSIASTPATQLWTYSASSGISLTVFLTVLGIAIFLVSRWYNKRRGINVELIFKRVPPE